MQIPAALLPLVLALPAAAQVTVQVGPDPAPLGGPLFASVTNDTDLIMGIGGCPWRIVDTAGAVVFEPTCFIQELLVGPLGAVHYGWDQVDAAGAPVAPGVYRFQVQTPGGAFDVPFQVGGVDANLHLMGTPAIGTAAVGLGGRHVALSAPSAPGGLHWLAAAFATAPGTPTCAGTVPLAADPLLAVTLNGGVLANALGTLDAKGFSNAPLLPLPDDQALVGLGFALAFVVLDPGAPCPVRHISPALELTVAPGAQPF